MNRSRAIFNEYSENYNKSTNNNFIITVLLLLLLCENKQCECYELNDH